MPFDGSGTFTPAASSWNPAVSGTEISHTDWNTLRDEIAAGLTKAICKDGQSTTSAVITFAVGVKINNTGLQVFDTNASHYLSIVPGSDLTAARTFTLTTGDAARTLDMSAGNLTAGGGQYVFPASQNASADANTLDDYEEGTFTAGIAFGGGTTGITYTTQLGWYQKVGNTVTIVVNVKLSNKGSSSGTVTITGLPFACNATIFSIFACRAELVDLNVAGAFYSPGVANTLGGTTLTVREQGDNVAVTSLTEADFSNTSEICVSGSYFV